MWKLILRLSSGFLILSNGCASVPTADKITRDLDLGLVVPYTLDLNASRPFKPPYLDKFTREDKTLYYVAAVHTSVVDYPNLLEHPTILTIKRIFDEHTVDAVVIEGVPPWTGAIGTSLLKHGDDCENIGYKVNCGEPWYTIQKAKKRNLDIYTGEPSEKEILELVKSKGYSVEDLLGFYVSRQIPEWKREGTFPVKETRQLMDKFIASYQRAFETNVKFKFEEFQTWYKAKVKTPANFADIEVDDTAPIGTADATYLEKISSVIGIARDRSIVARIAEVFKNHSNILVVFGASHVLVEQPALEKALGPAQATKLF